MPASIPWNALPRSGNHLGISKAGSRVLRYLLVEAANIAIRKDEDLKRFYHRLAAPRPGKGQSNSRQKTSHPRLHHDAR